MTYRELLEEYLDREMHNRFCYSANYLMDTPKKGYEKEFAAAVERANLLAGLIEQLGQG